VLQTCLSARLRFPAKLVLMLAASIKIFPRFAL
jgi:hypothetical protein